MYDNQMQMMIYGFTDKINKRIIERDLFHGQFYK